MWVFWVVKGREIREKNLEHALQGYRIVAVLDPSDVWSLTPMAVHICNP